MRKINGRKCKMASRKGMIPFSSKTFTPQRFINAESKHLPRELIASYSSNCTLFCPTVTRWICIPGSNFGSKSDSFLARFDPLPGSSNL